MSFTDVLFSIVGIEERETKRKVWNYYNSVFCNILVPIFYIINILYLYNANIFNDFDVSASIPLYLDSIIKIVLRSILTIGSIIYINIVFVGIGIIALSMLILYLGDYGFFHKIGWEEKSYSSDGFVYTSNYYTAMKRLIRLLLYILTEFWIVYCFSKNLLNNTFDAPKVPSTISDILWGIASTYMIYIIILKLFFIRYRDDKNRIKPEDIILKNNSRYITLNHYTEKSKDGEMEECYYMVKDTFLKGERFIYFHFSIKKNSFREKMEYITKKFSRLISLKNFNTYMIMQRKINNYKEFSIVLVYYKAKNIIDIYISLPRHIELLI